MQGCIEFDPHTVKMIPHDFAGDLQITGGTWQGESKGETFADRQFLARNDENTLRRQVLGGAINGLPVDLQFGIYQIDTARVFAQVW